MPQWLRSGPGRLEQLEVAWPTRWRLESHGGIFPHVWPPVCCTKAGTRAERWTGALLMASPCSLGILTTWWHHRSWTSDVAAWIPRTSAAVRQKVHPLAWPSHETLFPLYSVAQNSHKPAQSQREGALDTLVWIEGMSQNVWPNFKNATDCSYYRQETDGWRWE